MDVGRVLRWWSQELNAMSKQYFAELIREVFEHSLKKGVCLEPRLTLFGTNARVGRFS